MNIILFPGAFDPIHNGHINMAKSASTKFDADVIFIPATVSVWKSDSAPFVLKTEIIKEMIKDNSRFVLSTYEGEIEEGVHYSIDTIKHFKEVYSKDKLFLLIGGDQVNEFHRWKDAEEISRLTQIIYFSRPDISVNENVNKYKMIAVEGKAMNDSSTSIREMKGIEQYPRSVLSIIESHKLYYIAKINSFIGDYRLNHSISVANLAYDIALSNKLDNPIKAYIAGLLHDIGKEVESDYAEEIMDNCFKEYLDMPRFAYHQFIGSYIAMKKFNINDREILEAIRFHATGREEMGPLEKIIYAADKIEPTRGFDSSDLIKACLDDYENGFIKVLDANRGFLISKNGRGNIENRLTKSCFKRYLNK